ncbi:MAG: PqqD family protein [Chitinispirillia bacterium]|jgi:hypothetical protein
MDITRLYNLAISDTGFIFDPVSGNSYNTNETGVYILKKLKERLNVEEIAEKITEIYDVEHEVAEQDIFNLIEFLQSNYLV